SPIAGSRRRMERPEPAARSESRVPRAAWVETGRADRPAVEAAPPERRPLERPAARGGREAPARGPQGTGGSRQSARAWGEGPADDGVHGIQWNGRALRRGWRGGFSRRASTGDRNVQLERGLLSRRRRERNVRIGGRRRWWWRRWWRKAGQHRHVHQRARRWR